MSSLPDVFEVMRRIERCKAKPNRLYMKAIFEFCARGIEVAGELTSTDKARHTHPYGPTGRDVSVTEIEAPDIPANQMLKIILTALSNKEEAIALASELSKKIKVAVFKVRIAKQHLDKGEGYPYRLVALPLDKRLDPWSQELLDYYNDAGDDYVFPFSRQDNWEHITRHEKIFDGLYYRIKKYHWFPNGIVTEESTPCLSHRRLFKCHAIRHVRTDQLIKYLKIDGFDLGALVGWSMGSSNKVSAAPAQASNYAEIREAWPRYIHKLCVPFNYSAFLDNQQTEKVKK
jgi:hypothetical protein